MDAVRVPRTRWRLPAVGRCPGIIHELALAGQHFGPAVEEAARPGGIGWGEMGWILETNEPMNRAMEGMGGTIVKRYRIFEKAL